MSKVIFKPKREKPVGRYFVGLRLAWLYPEGTILEQKNGRRWIKVEDEQEDSWGWWAES